MKSTLLNFKMHDGSRQFGDYWIFVRDPICPDDILKAVVEHCETLPD